MPDSIPAEFGERPQGHGVTANRWRQWEKAYDALPSLRMPAPFNMEMPKTAVAKEIYLAGAWVQFQLKRRGAPEKEIERACYDVGTSAFLVVQQGATTSFYPQPLWKEAKRLARIEEPDN